MWRSFLIPYFCKISGFSRAIWAAFRMKGAEFRSFVPVSIFMLFFSSFFIISLIYLLAVNLGMVSRFPTGQIQKLVEKVEMMRPMAKSVVEALLIGAAGGLGATVLALIYNIFSSIFGGVRAEIKE
jgi:hypothetical protein